ncbi:hypothetical protein [Clostridium butyricum]|uniref:hypothetical protein n=1 Tax=Clostridium butyricum TaxID=1492 RepID=UPI0022E95B0B|nr:hypothetical protein [Clostridium butyricum]
MKIFYFSENKEKGYDAGNKARNDVEQILSIKYTSLFPYKYFSDKKFIMNRIITTCNIIKCLLKLNKKDRIIIQYPMKDGYNWMLPYICKIRKFIFIIHDLTELRSGIKYGKEIKRFIDTEYIISHNKNMTEYLVNCGIEKAKIFDLNIFDYIANNCIETNHHKDFELICFAGNLDKSKFLYNLPKNLLKNGINIYGKNVDKSLIKDGVNYLGAFDSEIIHNKLCGKFGLIWDGDECNTCTGKLGEYMKYNNPHKLSMYIVSGMPVITWEKAAIASFILNNNIGFVVKSLDEIVDKVCEIDEEEYQIKRQNILDIRNRIKKGKSLERLLIQIEEKINKEN